MESDACGCANGDLSFMCCVALADLAQAAGDVRKAEHYISLAYAAMDRREASIMRAPQMRESQHSAFA
jgi:hypothetical protein